MIYVFDLDGTLCDSEAGQYGDAKPNEQRVEQVRALQAAGATIVISTARGKMWKDFTRRQLLQWNIPYNVLSVGDKPYGDFYIDDRGINALDFFGER